MDDLYPFTRIYLFESFMPRPFPPCFHVATKRSNIVSRQLLSSDNIEWPSKFFMFADEAYIRAISSAIDYL